MGRIKIIFLVRLIAIPTVALFLVLLFMNPSPSDLISALNDDWDNKSMRVKPVIIKNNHTGYLSLRCFTYDHSLEIVHLKPGNEYRFNATRGLLFPQSSMYNCSTNMGVFVVFNYVYECFKNKYTNCSWSFDENYPYLYDPKDHRWLKMDYLPTYESLTKGGVVLGFFTN